MDGFDDDDDELLAAVEINAGSNGGRVSGEEKTVVVPDDFSFPFEAYDIQKDFMKELYKCLELGNVGIFESPTGTGKSLSLICGALRWLKDYQKRQQEELDSLLAAAGTTSDRDKESQQKDNGNTELDWIAEFAEKKKEEENIKIIKEMQDQRLKKEEKLNEMKDRVRSKKRKLDKAFDDLMEGAADDVRKAYEAEIKNDEAIHAAGLGKNGTTKEDDDLLLADYNSDEETDEKNEEDEIKDNIYYCSRTHSQLSQFVREVMKSPYGEDVKVISLGSRQNLCINSAVKQLKSQSLINDACLDLQRNKSTKGSKKTEPSTKRQRSAGGGTCPFYKQDNVQAFKDRALVEVKDVEHLVLIGKELKACPYYGTRLAIPDAELVVLPYNTLLHKSTREACGIKLQGNIVVVDEAHNLLETINNIYSTEISGAQVARASSQLGQYESRYRTRLTAINLMYIKQILHILSSLANSMGGKIGIPADKQTISSPVASLCTINDFLFRSQLDNINLFKVLRFCKGSQISRKLHGFTERYQNEVRCSEPEKKETSRSAVTSFLKSISSKENSSGQTATDKLIDTGSPEFEAVIMSSPLMHIEGFLQALTNADKDGRIVINKQGLFSKSSIKFLHLNPAVHFATVLQEARAVIVAGGTMQPADEFRNQLFHAAGVNSSRIQEFSCGHVIPSNQLLPIALSTGPTGIQLDFTFQNRNKPQLLDELGRLLCNVCNVVPGGVVCFFPSYDYEKLLFSHWEKGGVISKLEGKKKLYREPKRAGQVEQILGEYSSCIKKCGTWSTSSVTGAVLFCVVGGKMSEGINFSDELGRCVIMVGLPYPNRHSPELKEKMDYLNANFPKDKDGHLPGQVHYENLCMKAVNQSIGRAIRHRGDYATILLLDGRYKRPSTVSKLPGWISKHLKKMDRFGPAIAAISRFFGDKKIT